MAGATAGIGVQTLYLEVLQPAQIELGRLWELGLLAVADEHLGSQVTQMAMSVLYPYVHRDESSGLSMIAACVDGELHEIGVRMVADFFEMAGADGTAVDARDAVRRATELCEERGLFRPAAQ